MVQQHGGLQINIQVQRTDTRPGAALRFTLGFCVLVLLPPGPSYTVHCSFLSVFVTAARQHLTRHLFRDSELNAQQLFHLLICDKGDGDRGDDLDVVGCQALE
mmetsp:Transcript_12699/g.27525  ORF Transcript_12699/g.27525 Transcript_12699/m.27525 type:complete len:103 (-) Transcript_12699:1266-1574(-)